MYNGITVKSAFIPLSLWSLLSIALPALADQAAPEAAVEEGVAVGSVSLVVAENEPLEALLDVGLVIFDPGIPADKSSHSKLGIFPEIRKAEAQFIPVFLRQVLIIDGQQAFGRFFRAGGLARRDDQHAAREDVWRVGLQAKHDVGHAFDNALVLLDRAGTQLAGRVKSHFERSSGTLVNLLPEPFEQPGVDMVLRRDEGCNRQLFAIGGRCDHRGKGNRQATK